MQHWLPSPDGAPADLTAFAPVPRKYRYDGWTAQRQRDFVAALAATGSVTAAARQINMSTFGAYYLRRQPGAEGFRAAWAAALASGLQRLTDIAIDRAIDGVPVPVFHKGEQVGEKRRYNDRLLMFVMKHHLPALYDPAPIPRGTRHPETVAREAAENCPVCKARTEARPDEDAAVTADREWLRNVLVDYEHKVKAERRDRLAGRYVAADFTLRQLTHIELILDHGGFGMEMLALLTEAKDANGDTEQLFASTMSAELDTLRRQIWEAAEEPRRPPLTFPRVLPSSAMSGGSTMKARRRAQEEAEATIAAAQAKWEAAATEEEWARFRGLDAV